MKQVSVMLFVLVFFIVGCGGGGGSSSGAVVGGGTAPTLSSVVFTPPSAAAGSTINLVATFNFSDPDGNLNGGSLKFTYEGTTTTVSMGSEFAGKTSGIGILTISSGKLSSTVGNISVPVLIIDNTSKSSNTITVVFTQT